MTKPIPAPGYVPNPKTQPSPEGAQQITIRPGSKMAVLGVFVEIVRRRFAAETCTADFQWLWDRDIKKTKIAVESAFNEDQAHRNFRPAIFIDCDDQTHGRVVIGDRAGKNFKTGMDAFWNLQTVPILIECVTAKRAESAVLGDLVGVFIQASSDLIQAAYGFHDMTPVVVGRTQPSTRDKDQWITSVTFNVQYPMRWTNVQTAPLLQRIEATIAASTSTTADEFFEEIALGWQDQADEET